MALGNELVHSKKLSQPLALGIGAAVPPQLDLEAFHVQNYARAHPDEDLEDSKDTAETGPPVAPVEPPPFGDAATSSAAGAVEQEVCGQKRPSASLKRTKFKDVSFSLLESTFLVVRPRDHSCAEDTKTFRRSIKETDE